MQVKTDIPQSLPQTGFVRLSTILGKPKANPPIAAIIPVSKSTWWEGINKGIYPKPIKLSERTTAWEWQDINNLVVRLGGET